MICSPGFILRLNGMKVCMVVSDSIVEIIYFIVAWPTMTKNDQNDNGANYLWFIKKNKNSSIPLSVPSCLSSVCLYENWTVTSNNYNSGIYHHRKIPNDTAIYFLLLG